MMYFGSEIYDIFNKMPCESKPNYVRNLFVASLTPLNSASKIKQKLLEIPSYLHSSEYDCQSVSWEGRLLLFIDETGHIADRFCLAGWQISGPLLNWTLLRLLK